MTLVTALIRLIRAAKDTYARKWTFLAAFLVVFFLTIVVMAKLDLLPDASKADADASTPTVTVSSSPLVAAAASAMPAVGELPTKIAIPSINLSVSVANPESTDIDVLDNDLLKGAVRYPTSAKLGEANGNVIIFGHSSYLPIVNNSAYKTFDGIQKLKAGATITVYSSGTAYDYSVDTVTKEDATSAAIPLTVSGQELTLSTCDSFASKSDRFVVTAHLVDSHLLTN